MSASQRALLVLIGTLVVADGALVAALAVRALPASTTSLEAAPGDGAKDRLLATLESNGLAAALDLLEQLAVADSVVLRGGHQLAHTLGREALASSAGDPGILGQCRPTFASGCYHGVVEALLHRRGRVDMVELQQMCEVTGTSRGVGAMYECVHGLGHGVFGALNGDVGAALGHCDYIARGSLAASCHEGVFMEAITAALRSEPDHAAHAHGIERRTGAHAFSIDSVDPYSPCDRYTEPYADSCWLFQGFVILRAVDFDANRALGICDAAPEARRNRCYESVGHQLAGLFQRGDAWVNDQCRKGQPGRAARCASGAAIALAFMDWSGRRVKAYCASVPIGWSGACLETAAEALKLVAGPES